MVKLPLDIHIFQGISKSSKEKLRKMNKRLVNYSARELVFNEGEKIENICIVLEGMLKCTEYTPQGKELNSSYFAAGDAFPFYLLYGGEKNYFFNTYAVKKSKVILLPIDELFPIIESDIKFMKNIAAFIADYTCYNKRILRLLQYNKIEERLAYWLLNLNNSQDKILVPNSQEVLADILHISRSSLNQELVKLKKKGVLRIEGKEIIINNLIYLENLI